MAHNSALPGLLPLTLSAMMCLPHHAQAEVGFVTHFGSKDPDAWTVANYTFTHPAFDTDWHADQVSFQDGLTLTLGPQADQENRFVGASVRRKQTTHFGQYEAVLQPAKGDGLVTGFFTYTGPYYGTQHDEIDIEFLGQDTTKLHVAWFVDGVLHQRDIPLGFDAALAPRRYGFLWTPHQITWTVDAQPIFTVTAAQAPIPQEPGMMFANLWAVDQSLANWAGHAAPDTQAQAAFKEVRFRPWAPETAPSG